MSFEPVKRILHRSLTVSPARQTIEIAQIFSAWDAVLRGRWGEEKAACVQPLSFREGVLKVTTPSSAAKQMLEIEKEHLKQGVNHRLGSLSVHRIVVVWKPA